MSASTVLQLHDSDEYDEQTAYVHSILDAARYDPARETELICSRKRRTIKERSKERDMHQRHLQRKVRLNKNQRRRRQEAVTLTPLEKIRLRKGELPHNLNGRKLSARQQQKVDAIVAARYAVLEPNQADFMPGAVPDEALHVPMGKLLNGLELEGVRFVVQVVDGVTVFIVDQICIIPAA